MRAGKDAGEAIVRQKQSQDPKKAGNIVRLVEKNLYIIFTPI